MKTGIVAWLVTATLLVAAADARAALFVTELLASNDTVLADEDGDFSDWVEIYNAGPGAVDLGGWYLTDDAADLIKWQFPATPLSAGQYLVVFASDKNRAVAGQELHTGFKLSAGGEYFALVQSDGLTVEHAYDPEFPEQSPDVSYGLASDLSTERCFHDPTPGAPNDESQGCGPIDALSFSPSRGFYFGPIAVALSTTTGGADIYYTLDGSEPTDATATLYGGPVALSTTTAIRARAYAPGLTPTRVATHSYIYPDDVVLQTDPGFPDTWSSDYEMDPRIVTDPRYAGTITDDLMTIATVSIVTDVDHLFGEANGIYNHPDKRGVEWERPASVEIITADGSEELQVDCGIRIQGDLSRALNKKKSLRLAFKSIYGPDRLDYPFFENNRVDSFNKIRLRAGNQDCWCSGANSTTYVRDQFVRDSQLAIGRESSRGRFVHVYLNGAYWGVYNAVEKPDESFQADHFGGAEQDWDVMKHAVEVVAGNSDAWFAAQSIAQSGLSSPAAYAALRDYVDVPNLVDYMIVNQYVGTGDWDGNNWYAGRERVAGGLWRFFSWDAEISMSSITTNKVSIDNGNKPSALYSALRENDEFRILFGDHVHRHFFNDGALTRAAAEQRYFARVAEIDRAIVAESARWGDIRHSTPLTRDDDWLVETEWIRLVFLPQRPNKLIEQYQKVGLYPSVAAPVFDRHGGLIDAGFSLEMTAPDGTIHYTLDGSDPRLEGGAVSPAAAVYAAPVPLLTTSEVNARVLVGGQWSALNQALFIVDTPVRIAELMYHPADPPSGPYADEDFEYIELVNTGSATIDLAGMQFTNGVTFTFPSYLLVGGARALVVSNPAAFESRYGAGLPVIGSYLGRLDNGGEKLRLDSAASTVIQELVYDDAWYRATDGDGFSLTIVDPAADPSTWSTKAAWAASTFVDGSPTGVDPAQCNDGVDNDSDGDTDWPADAGCAGASAPLEKPPCSDGVDNDLDGRIDGDDPGCADAGGQSETDPAATSFVCYGGRDSKSVAKFEPVDVTLDDALEGELAFTARKRRAICLAATFDGNTPADANVHLQSYDIRVATSGVTHPVVEDLQVRAIGPMYLETSKPNRLLVPAAMHPTDPVLAPPNGAHDVDHYKCYRAKIPSGTPKYYPSKVLLRASDQFEDRLYNIKKPKRLCNAVDVNGQGIKDGGLKLTCYKLRRAKGEVRHERLLGVQIADEIGSVLFDTKKAREICVPTR